MPSIFCYDPTVSDDKSKVRGVGRYLQILKENFPDWVFTNKLEIRNSKLEIFVNPFFNFLQKPLTLRRVAKRQVAVIHDLIPLKYPDHFPVGLKGKINIFLNKLALRNYDLVVTDSEASKRDIMKILEIDENKVKVIYPCLPEVFSMKYKVSGIKSKNTKYEILDTKYCLYVGDATWNKNLVNLAKAIKIINVTCVFVGNVFNTLTREHVNGLTSYNKWQKEFKLFLKETANDKRFIFLGYVSDKDLLHLYKNASCNLLVSRDEGFGFSYLEAASQECPSVLADTPVLHEISNNKGAFFSESDDSNGIANAIGEIYFNKEVRNSKGAEAKTRLSYFSQNRFKKNFLKIVQ